MEKLLSKIPQNGLLQEAEDLIQELQEQRKEHLKKPCKVKLCTLCSPKTNQRAKEPGSYKSVLNRKNKDFGCLFLETSAKENGIVRNKVEGNFVLHARKRFKDIRKMTTGHPKPILKQARPLVQYSEVRILCKLNCVVPKIQGKPWRKHSYIDIKGNPLGLMITRDTDEFSVHQACMDYAHGMHLI